MPELAGEDFTCTLTQAQRYTQFKWNEERNMFLEKHTELLKDKR